MQQCFCSQFRVSLDHNVTLIDGCPAGIKVTSQDLLESLARFLKSYTSTSSQQLGANNIQILQGVENNQTTGEQIQVQFVDCFDEVQNYASYVIAGVFALRYLGADVRLRGALVQLGEHIVDRSEWNWNEVSSNDLFSPNAKAAKFWGHFLDKVKEADQSVGAVVELQASGFPAGLMGSAGTALDGEIARALMSIDGAKGVEMGGGFALAALTGKLCEDQQEESADGIIRFKTNKAGGVMNGRSTGQDIIARFAVQPTLLGDEDGKPRHPCVGISAVPVGEALLACVLAGAKLQKETALAAAS